MEITKRKSVSLGVDITPLIDIVFLLLIFFMLTSTFMRDEAIELALPESETGAAQETDLLRVVAVKEDEYLLDGTQYTKGELESELEKQYAQNPEKEVLLKIDKEADVQLLVAGMDILKKVGFTDISLATE